MTSSRLQLCSLSDLPIAIRFDARSSNRSATLGRPGEMPKAPPKQQQRAGRSRPGLSLEKFAAAKTTKYDKRAKAEELRALKQRRLSKYRKLTARLQRDGRLAPVLKPESQGARDHCEDSDTLRALARAGPAAGDDSGDSEGVGHASPPSSPVREAEGHANKLREEDIIGVQQASEQQEARQSGLPGEGEVRPKKRRQKNKQKPASQLQRLAAEVQAAKAQKRAEKDKAHQEMEARQKRIAETERQRKKERELFWKRTKRGQPVMKHRMDKILSKLHS